MFSFLLDLTFVLVTMDLALSQKLDGLVALLHMWHGTMLFPPGSYDEPKIDLCSYSGFTLCVQL